MAATGSHWLKITLFVFRLQDSCMQNPSTGGMGTRATRCFWNRKMPSAREQALSGARGRHRRPGISGFPANTRNLLATWVPWGGDVLRVLFFHGCVASCYNLLGNLSLLRKRVLKSLQFSLFVFWIVKLHILASKDLAPWGGWRSCIRWCQAGNMYKRPGLHAGSEWCW